MYRAVRYFEDLQDGRHPYSEGDEYPRNGLEVTEERISELATTANRRHVPVIEKARARKGGRPTKAELLEEAASLGLEVPEGATNPEIHSIIKTAKES